MNRHGLHALLSVGFGSCCCCCCLRSSWLWLAWGVLSFEGKLGFWACLVGWLYMAQESWKMDKDEMGCQAAEGPMLCANNCGFFGSATTMNLCSKCYRDLVLKQTKAAKAAASVPTVVNEQHVNVSDRHPDQEAIISTAASTSQSIVGNTLLLDSSQQPLIRCLTCKKRVGLTGFKCRCGDTFCALHRYSDKHNCPFDYKTAARDAIAKANPVIKADKLDKI